MGNQENTGTNTYIMYIVYAISSVYYIDVLYNHYADYTVYYSHTYHSCTFVLYHIL